MRRGVGRVALAGRVFGVCLGHMGFFVRIREEFLCKWRKDWG